MEQHHWPGVMRVGCNLLLPVRLWGQVMEYADRGSLTDAIVNGRFFTPTHELDMVGLRAPAA